ncbi:ATP-binding protein [Archangium gephyra]|nr:ATP-binding protein [Archangium gephyra]
MLLSSAQTSALFLRLDEILSGQNPGDTIGVWLGLPVRSRIGIRSSVHEYIHALLRFLDEEGLAPKDPAILRLLRLPDLDVFPELQQIRTELEARKKEQTADDPYARCQLHVGPFLDRTRFRVVLRRFVDRVTGPRVLVVNGPAQSGKTYSSWFVSHLNDTMPSFVTFAYAAEKGLAETYTLGDVARDLVQLAKGQPATMPPQRAQEKRWAQELCIWILSALNRPGLPFWLVLDGFRDAPPGTQALIQYLANHISQALNQTDGRLLLFDYEPRLLAPCPVELEELRAIEPPDISEYFQRLLPGQDAAIIQRAVTEVLQRVTLPPTDPGWQSQVSMAVREVSDALR